MGFINLLLYILLCLSISILYIHKLYVSFQSSTEHLELLSMIIKTSILNFMTMLVTLLSAICFIFWTESIYLEFLAELSMAIDAFTNFLCVILSYKYYEKVYFTLCGCLHWKCNDSCTKPRDQIGSLSLQNL